MEIKKKYADQWNNSSKYFYSKNYYKWMETDIHDFQNILEVGCGCGYSTLSLVEQGHKVLSLDKNSHCIDMAYDRIQEKGFENEAAFLEVDISYPGAVKELADNYQFDIVICWNMGSYYDFEELRSLYPRMLAYGLKENQIKENVASSYCEFITWNACMLAAKKGVPFHLVDRAVEEVTEKNDVYYYHLGREFGYSKITYRSMMGTSLSAEGVQLKKNGELQNDPVIPIILNSILFTEKL